MYKKGKRILALLGAIILVGMYLVTLIFALLDLPWTGEALKVSLVCSLVIPVLLYGYILMYKVLKRDDPMAKGAEENDRK